MDLCRKDLEVPKQKNRCFAGRKLGEIPGRISEQKEHLENFVKKSLIL